VAAIAALPCAPSLLNLQMGLVSDGYGELAEIHGDSLSIFEITSISCLPSSTGTRKPGKAAGQWVDFAVDDDVVRFLPGATADDARVHVDGAVSDILMHRLSAEELRTNTPEHSAGELRELLANLRRALRVLRFAARGLAGRGQTVPSGRNIAHQAGGAVQHLSADDRTAAGCAHWGAARGTNRFHGIRPDPNHLDGEGWLKAREIIGSKYLAGDLQSFCNGHVQFGMLRASIAYLRVDSFNSYARGTFADELVALQSALDSVFRDAQHFRGLVIDVRRNSGGADPLGVEIASRLTGERYLAYSKVTRNNPDGPLHFTAP
jgi:hypothetical protein